MNKTLMIIVAAALLLAPHRSTPSKPRPLQALRASARSLTAEKISGTLYWLKGGSWPIPASLSERSP